MLVSLTRHKFKRHTDTYSGIEAASLLTDRRQAPVRGARLNATRTEEMKLLVSVLVSEFALHARAKATSGHFASLSASYWGSGVSQLLGPPPSPLLNLGTNVQLQRLSFC